MRLSGIGEAFLDLLYPPKCPFCRKILPKKEIGFCDACRAKLPWIAVTGQRRNFGVRPGDPGGICFSPLHYDEFVRNSFLRYKFHGAVSFAPVYGKIMADCILQQGITADVLTWVPLSRRRLRKRGYDQAELLAREVSVVLGLDAVQLLYKNRDNKAQSLTGDAKSRRENVRGVYSVADPAGIEGKSILLVDDIITTGATLAECRDLLLRAGASEVRAVTFARA